MKRASIYTIVSVVIALCALGLRGLFSSSSSSVSYHIQITQPAGGDTYHIGDFIKVAWTGDSFPKEYYMSVDLVDGQIPGIGHLWTVFPIPTSQSAVVPIPLAVVQGSEASPQLKPGPYKFRLTVYDKHFCYFDCKPQDLGFHLVAHTVSGPVQLLEYVPKNK